MSKQKPPKKRVVTTGNKKSTTTAPSTRKRSSVVAEQRLEFGRQNYILMGVGVVLISLGLLLMSGGSMPSADVWDDNIIYSARRISIAPILILLGLVVEVYAIFKKA